MPKLPERFRTNFSALLKKKGFSQKEFGEKIGMKPQVINKYFKGHRSPGLEVLEKIASGLEVSPAELVTNDYVSGQERLAHLSQELSRDEMEDFFQLVEEFGGWRFLYNYISEEILIREKGLSEAREADSNNSIKQAIITNIIAKQKDTPVET